MSAVTGRAVRASPRARRAIDPWWRRASRLAQWGRGRQVPRATPTRCESPCGRQTIHIVSREAAALVVQIEVSISTQP